jgi:hypothetical protein
MICYVAGNLRFTLSASCDKTLAVLYERCILLRNLVSLIQMLMLLQVLRLEMDAQQRRIPVLQESVLQLVSDSDSFGSNNMLEKVEMLQDRWDALIQIMEVQGQRVRIIHSYCVKNRFTHVLLIMYYFNKCYSQIIFSIQISNSGFEFNMVPPSGEEISAMLPEQQWEMNKAVTATPSQQVSLVCSLINPFLFKPAPQLSFCTFVHSNTVPDAVQHFTLSVGVL